MTGLSWATRGSHGTGSIFPLKRLQVQLRVLNSSVILAETGCSVQPCFRQAAVSHRERVCWRYLLNGSPHGLEHTDVFFPSTQGHLTLPLGLQAGLLRLAAPGSYRPREARRPRFCRRWNIANASTIGTARPWFYFQCKEQMFN